MGRGAAFSERLSDWIAAQFQGDVAQVLVLVPTARVAARVRALLAAEFQGVLPAILPLRGNGELADLLGFRPQAMAVLPVAARVEIGRFLGTLVNSDGEPWEALGGERLWRRVDGLYRLLDRLALHGITAVHLRETVPVAMVGFWEVQAATLLAVAEHMAHWLARRGEVLPGEVERRILEQAATVFQDEACGWVPVVAGVLDGIPAAHALARVAAARGAVLVPDSGPVTRELGDAFRQLTDTEGVVLAGATDMVREAVAETDWDEAWLAALAVKRAVDAGRKRVAVVSPAKTLLRRVAGILAQFGLTVTVSGDACMDRTPAGRAALAAPGWGLRAGRPADFIEAMRGYEVEEPVLEALGALGSLEAWLEAADWQALMGLVLGETQAPGQPVSGGISLLGPLDARLMDFDSVIVAGAVEGTWPGASSDTWLSEAHLRALGLPDAARKALLAGTEFESLLAGGSGEVVVIRARTVEGKETVPSRFLAAFREQIVPDMELPQALAALRAGAMRHDGVLGVFTPEGALWPTRWSASLTEALLACPYKALGERVLRLVPLDPLTPEPDARLAGLLAHRWLERAGKEIAAVTPETSAQVVKRLLDLAEFELRHETPVVRAIWRAKFAKLAPALVAQWMADGRTVKVVEQRLKHAVGPVTVTATLDRVEAAGGGAVIIDYKTSTPPTWAAVASGERPQLAIEAWLLGRDGGVVADVEYWHLKGYGTSPLKVASPGNKYPLEDLLAPVEGGLTRLVATYGEGAAFPAIPDMAGGGLMATGHCARCALAGVCRRQTAAETARVGEVLHG